MLIHFGAPVCVYWHLTISISGSFGSFHKSVDAPDSRQLTRPDAESDCADFPGFNVIKTFVNMFTLISLSVQLLYREARLYTAAGDFR